MAVVKIAIPEVLPPVEESIVEIPTTRFGALTIPATEIYEMGEGMHGFPELRRFLLLAPDPPGGLFYWWQAVDEPAIAFPCCDPGKIFPDYRIHSDEADVLRLRLADRRSLQVLVVVTVPPHRPEEITANLLGPLVMDPEAHEAWQLICERSDHRVAAPLLPALQRAG